MLKLVPHGLNRTTDGGLQNRYFTTKLVGRNMVCDEGFEPPTSRFQAEDSTGLS